MAEYLHYAPLGMSSSSAEVRNEPGRMLSVESMLFHLVLAQAYVVNTPGPNQQRRQKLSPNWLGYWIEQLQKFRTPNAHGNVLSCDPDTTYRTTRIASLDTTGEQFNQFRRQGLTTGIAMMATGDGSPGQRHFIDEIFNGANHVQKLCLVLENSEYFQTHDRRWPFLPVILRASMWAFYNVNIHIAISPPRRDLDEVDYYRDVYRRSKAVRSLASEGDPFAQEKIHRGLFNPTSTLISEWDGPHTSDMAEALMLLPSIDPGAFGHMVTIIPGANDNPLEQHEI